MNDLSSLLKDGFRFVIFEDKMPGTPGDIHVQVIKYPYGLAKEKSLIGSGKTVDEAFADLFSVDVRASIG